MNPLPEKLQWPILFVLAAFVFGCAPRAKESDADKTPASAENTLTVYTFRNYDNDQHLFRLFEQRSGFKINVVKETSEALVSRLLSEGSSSPASLVILEDVSMALRLKQQQALQQGDFTKLGLTFPSDYLDPQNYWVGLCKWAPAFVYSTDKVNQQLISRYGDVANPRWKGKVLVTSSSKAMNQVLVSSMLSGEGADAATAWTTGVVANLAQAPLADDYAIIQALAQGKGDIGILNASSLIQYQRSGNPEAFKQAEGLSVLYPVGADGKTYYNLTVAGIPAHAPKADVATRLLEFLADQEVQQLFAETLYEYPANPYSLPNDFLIDIGGITEKAINFELLGQNLEKAKSIMDAAVWK